MSAGQESLSELEHIKESSRGLRGDLAAELVNDASHLTSASGQLLKFHGSYQQEDRDQRRERKARGEEPAYQFMVRSRVPGGVLTAAQYLAHDDLADRYGNGTLRVTTRQTIQLHGVIKRDLRSSIRALNDALVSTLATCGDVNRNVMTCPAPVAGGLRRETLALARRLSDHLLPSTPAYHELWLDGEKVSGAPSGHAGRPAGGDTGDRDTAEGDAVDPLYGTRYMPRKFKAALGFPDDNCVDLLTNDLGFLAVVEGSRLLGFDVLAGGGLGMTHGKEETFPRLADRLGFARVDDVLEVATAVLSVQREHGDRGNRRHARMKYLIADRGVDWFRDQVEERLGRRLPTATGTPIHDAHDHLGWHRQEDGAWLRGVFVQSGRIQDDDSGRLRTGLRRVLEKHDVSIHLTPQQNVLLSGVPAVARVEVDAILADHGVAPPDALAPIRRWSMACPALPTCGLAVAESERVIPDVLARFESLLSELGLSGEVVSLRMTGCPNGCARPYTAEIAFVGRSLGRYVVLIGGSFNGTRLARHYADLVPLEALTDVVRPLLELWRDERAPGEGFGDYWDRVGVDVAPQPVAGR